jgi:hypothetical protein
VSDIDFDGREWIAVVSGAITSVSLEIEVKGLGVEFQRNFTTTISLQS